MIWSVIRGAARLLGAVCLLIGLSSIFKEASAQRSVNTPDAGDYSRDNGGGRGGHGHGGLGGAGGLLLQYAPGIINQLNNGDDDEDRPRRKRHHRQDTTDDNYDDDNGDGPSRTKPRHPSRVTAIPPLPVVPPDRFVPPSVTADTPPSPPLTRAAALGERPEFKPGEIVVMVRDAQPDAVAAQLAQNFNLVLQETLSFALLGTSRVYRFSIPDNRPVETITAAMANVPGVGFAAPNGYYWLEGGAGGSALELQYALGKMRVPDAQAIVNGRGMTVAVIDSGVDASHPALKHANLTLIDAVNGGVKGPDAHGTAVTGIIAASGDLVGIAPGAKIIAVRAFAPERLGTPPVTTATTLARAVDLAFSQGARIFNMSFAGRREPLLIDMIDAAYAQGAVFVAAAGNEGPNAPPAYPAAHDKVIAITATDESDALYDQANRGGYVLAAAPGVDILAPVTGQGFDYLSGTSFAAAHVTGIIALLMERNPQLSPESVREALVGSAHDLGPTGKDPEFGAGLTDAYGALMQVGKTSSARSQ